MATPVLLWQPLIIVTPALPVVCSFAWLNERQVKRVHHGDLMCCSILNFKSMLVLNLESPHINPVSSFGNVRACIACLCKFPTDATVILRTSAFAYNMTVCLCGAGGLKMRCGLWGSVGSEPCAMAGRVCTVLFMLLVLCALAEVCYFLV